ncbi:MAG: hypothetical protein RLZZ383_1895, partial [Pseudomonadota bacterium]
VEVWCDMAGVAWTLVANFYDSPGDDFPNDPEFVTSGWEQHSSGVWSSGAAVVAPVTTFSSSVPMAFVRALHADGGQRSLRMCFVHRDGYDAICRDSISGGLTLTSYFSGNPRLVAEASRPLVYTFGRLAGLAGSVDSYDYTSFSTMTYCISRADGAFGDFGIEGGSMCDHGDDQPYWGRSYNGVWHSWTWGATYRPWDVDDSEISGATGILRSGVANPSLNSYGFRLYVGP